MSPRGRPPKRAAHADQIAGSSMAKERLKIIMETISGERTVEDACRLLGLSESRFHELRNEALQAAMAALEPKPKGRPAAPAPSPEALEIQKLREQVTELSLEVKAGHIRETIRMVMPHLLKPREDEASKKKILHDLFPDTSKKSASKTKSTPNNSAPSGETST
jgi:transposase-like protein